MSCEREDEERRKLSKEYVSTFDFFDLKGSVEAGVSWSNVSKILAIKNGKCQRIGGFTNTPMILSSI